MARVGLAIHDSKVMGMGHHGTGIIGSFGAVVASGKLLKLDEKKMISALGLAAQQHTGLMEFFREGTMEKRFFAGKASHDGVLSAMLAARGFIAASSSLDGEYGFCRAFDKKANLAKLTQNLGKTFKLMETGIKPYPCCRTIHGYIDAAIKLAETHNISFQDIDEVLIWEGKPISDRHYYYQVPDIMAAQYCVPYCIARALMQRRVWVDDFTPHALKDSKTLELMQHLKGKYDRDIARTKGMNKLTVKLTSGEEFTETVYRDRMKGSAKDPAFKQVLADKFQMLTLKVLPQNRVDNIMRVVQGVAELEDVAELANAVGGHTSQ